MSVPGWNRSEKRGCAVDPVRQIRTHKDQGRTIIACFPLYPPLALLHSMGLVPIVLWGLRGHVFRTESADRHLPAYTCSVARHLAEFLLTDGRELIDGIFMYNACDTLRNMPEILADEMSAAERDVAFFCMHLPMTNQDQTGVPKYFGNEIKALVHDLSERFGIGFSPDRFQASVSLYQRMQRLALDAMGRVAAGRLAFSDFVGVMQAGAFLPVEDHIQAIAALPALGGDDFVGQASSSEDSRIGVMISGILPPPASMIAAVESAGLRIVADDVASLYRSYAVMPDPRPDPEEYYRIFYKEHYPCPTVLYTGDRRISVFLARLAQSRARGVIFFGEKFCEYEYLEFPFLKKKLAEKGIPVLEIDVSIDDGRHMDAHDSRIAAFAEMLRQ